MRVIFFGMPGRLSGPALAALFAAGAEVAVVAVPAPPGAPPVAAAPAPSIRTSAIPLATTDYAAALPPTGSLALAAARGVPALALRRMAAPEVRAALAAQAPDLAVVACWPWRIPPALLAVPRLGFLNLHPSPLPELRGPEPLFWALWEGRERTAVTLHWMDEGLDTGPIATAAPLELPLGSDWAAIEHTAAATGAALLAGLLPRLTAGELPRQPQGAGGSYRPAPAATDFTIEPGWSAERAFRLMRGTAAWNTPYLLSVGGQTYQLARALTYAPDGRLQAPLVVANGRAQVQMTPGVLEATLAR